MPEIVLGLLVGVLLAGRWGWDPKSTLVLAAVLALGLYLLSCVVWPFRRCGICGSNDRRGDGRGNHRRITCWWCSSKKDHPRVGARLMGRAGRE